MSEIFHNISVFLITYIGEVFGMIFGGGSFLVQPGLIALGIGAKYAVANDIAAACFTSCTYLYDQRKTVSQEFKKYIKIFIIMFPGIFIGTCLGAHVLKSVPSEYVVWFILFVATSGLLHMIYQMNTQGHQTDEIIKGIDLKYWQFFSFLAAIILGFYDGVSSAGGGTLQILAFAILFKMAMKELILMAAIFGAFSLSLASVNFFFIGLIDFQLLIIMIPAAVAAGFTASKIVGIVSEKNLRIAFTGALSVLLIYLFYSHIL